ncbi:hypothetical protein V475_06245 [Sphingobium baderi LL03]|nr:hypothetical protein V475_06245 [Sphingobium baderi LL03]
MAGKERRDDAKARNRGDGMKWPLVLKANRCYLPAPMPL